MVKLVALYRKPADVAAFEQHYFQTHLPLARRMPGLIRAEVARVEGSPTGDSPYHFIAELYFESHDALRQAMGSPEGREAARDLMGFARDLVSLHVAAVLEPNGGKA